MLKLFNRLYVSIATIGTGTVTFGAAVANNFLNASEAGVADNDVVPYILTEGLDFEVGLGTIGGGGTTLSRDTVINSKIAGVAGTTKLTLAGNARVYVDAIASENGALVKTWETIQSKTFSADADWSIADLSAYMVLRVSGLFVPATDAVALHLLTSTNNGVSFDVGASDYGWQNDYGTGAAGATSALDAADSEIELTQANAGNGAQEGVTLDLTIFDFNQAANCRAIGRVGTVLDTGSFAVGTVMGQRLSTTARDAFRIICSSGNIATGYALLEGIRG